MKWARVWLYLTFLWVVLSGCGRDILEVAEELVDTSSPQDSVTSRDMSGPTAFEDTSSAIGDIPTAMRDTPPERDADVLRPPPDLDEPPVEPSGIRLVDVTDTTTNPYRINRNTVALTRPGHTVELIVERSDPLLTVTWSATAGVLSSTTGTPVRWTAPTVGQDETIVTRLEATIEGDGVYQHHTLEVTTYQARALGVEHGDSHLAWTQIVYPEPGGHRHELFTFDRASGRLFEHGTSIGFQHGRRALVGDWLWYQSSIGPPIVTRRHVETGDETPLDLSPLLAAWDMRELRASADYLAWSQANTTYEAVTLYYMALTDPDAVIHHAMVTESIDSPIVIEGHDLYFTLFDSTIFPNVMRTYRLQLENGLVTELTQAPQDAHYLLQVEGGWLLYRTDGYTVFDTRTGMTRVLEGVTHELLVARIIEGVLWAVSPNPASGTSPATIEKIATRVHSLDLESGEGRTFDISEAGPMTGGRAELCWLDTRWGTLQWSHSDAELYCLDVD